MFLSLPDDVINKIVFSFDINTIRSICFVNKRLHALSLNEYLWETLVKRDFTLLAEKMGETWKTFYMILSKPIYEIMVVTHCPSNEVEVRSEVFYSETHAIKHFKSKIKELMYSIDPWSVKTDDLSAEYKELIPDLDCGIKFEETDSVFQDNLVYTRRLEDRCIELLKQTGRISTDYETIILNKKYMRFQ